MASIRYASDAIGDITVVRPDPCSPCQTKNGTTSRVAGWYCIDCEEFICNDCKAHHESFRMFRQHQIVTHAQGVERKDIFRELTELETCNIHKGKKLEFFCLSHKTFCCSVCSVEMHKKCGTTPQILERNRDKIIEASPDLLKVFQNLQKKTEDIQKQFDSNTKNFEKLRLYLPDIFKSLRKDISNLLDKAEQKLRLEIQELIKEEEKKTSDFKTRLFSSEKGLQNSVSLLKVSRDYGTEAQKIISEYEMASKSKKYENEIKSVEGVLDSLKTNVTLQPNFVKQLQTPEHIFNVSILGRQKASVFASPDQFPLDKELEKTCNTKTTLGVKYYMFEEKRYDYSYKDEVSKSDYFDERTQKDSPEKISEDYSYDKKGHASTSKMSKADYSNKKKGNAGYSFKSTSETYDKPSDYKALHTSKKKSALDLSPDLSRKY